MQKLLDWIGAPGTLLRQQQEISRLRTELAKQRAQNESMRRGMRRCTTCEYRLDFKARQAS